MDLIFPETPDGCPSVSPVPVLFEPHVAFFYQPLFQSNCPSAARRPRRSPLFGRNVVKGPSFAFFPDFFFPLFFSQR